MAIEKINITLCNLMQEHIPQYLAQFSSAVQSVLHVESVEEEHVYLVDRLEKIAQGKTFFYCIFQQNDNQLIGAVEIRDPDAHRGQLYCWLNEQYWGKGYMQEAIRLAACDYFKKTDKTYFNAWVDATNKRSYYALKKAGFADLSMDEGPYGVHYELVLRKK